MRKKFVIALLVLCCLTVPTYAASVTVGTPEYSSLQAFLAQFAVHGIYDSQNATASGKTFWGYTPTNIMDTVMSGEAVSCDYSIYPVEQPEEVWTGSDPLNRFGPYVRFPATSVEWVLKNIFNCSQSDIDSLKAYADKSSTFYYLNGSYYTFASGVGFMYSAQIRDITARGTQHCVTYDIVDGLVGSTYRYYAVLELKNISGKQHWSLYSNHALTAGQDPSKTGGFLDIQASAYYCEPVLWAVEQGITSGTSATTFSPNNTCTNAQILTFLWRANNSPEPGISNPFSNVSSSSYYYKAALWAYEKGLVSENSFNADTSCTRAMAVTYLWKLAGSPASGGNSFSDVSSSASYAQAVAWAVNRGITSGTSATTFSPNTACTRGQIMTFLYRNAGFETTSNLTPQTNSNSIGASWNSAYQDFVVNKKFLTAQFEYDHVSIETWGSDSAYLIALYDFDNDNTPELMISNGHDGRITDQTYVYTYTDESIQYIGTCWSYPSYIPGSKYLGLFVERSSGFVEDHAVIYYQKSGNKLNSETVYTYSLENENNKHQVTGDHDLFIESQNWAGWNRLYSASVPEIQQNGWDSFVDMSVAH